MDPAGLPLADFVSDARMSTYLAASGGDSQRAARLYSWNLEYTGALWGSIAVLEVVLRNALHDELTSMFGGPDWYDNNNLRRTLLDAGRGRIDRAKEDANTAVERTNERLAKEGKPLKKVTSNDVVGSASFGTWVGLLDSGIPRDPVHDYQRRLWDSGLKKAFPGYRGNRRKLHGDLDYIRLLRNRMAHHEHIFRWNPELVINTVVDLTGYINPDAARYIQNSNGVMATAQSYKAALDSGECCF